MQCTVRSPCCNGANRPAGCAALHRSTFVYTASAWFPPAPTSAVTGTGAGAALLRSFSAFLASSYPAWTTGSTSSSSSRMGLLWHKDSRF